MKRKIIAVLLSLSMAIGLCACGGSGSDKPSDDSQPADQSEEVEEEASDAAAAQIRDVINIANSSECATFDLHMTTENGARVTAGGTVYEQLLTLNANGEPVPELCDSYEVSDDATTFTFTLRQDVKFHDGSTMTAEDCVASMNRWIEAYSAAQNSVGDARFEKVDDATIKIQTDNPCVLLPYLMAGGAQRAVITTLAAMENVDDNNYMQEFIGTGPYVFAEWVHDQYVKLERFEDYVPYGNPEEPSDGWAGYKHAYAKELIYQTVTEEATRVAGLQTGQYDLANVGTTTFATVNNAEDLAYSTEEGGSIAIVYNKKEGLCTDINMRKAINAIVNSDEMLVVSYGEFYNLGSCYMESNQELWVTDAGSSQYNQMDNEKAKEYLDAAGYGGETVRILAASVNNFNKLGEILEAQLEAQGIDCEITAVDWPTFTSYREDPTMYDLYISSFSSVPVPSLKNYFGESFAGWTSDETLTEKLNILNSSLTIEDSQAAWVDLQEYCWEYLPITNLGHYESIDAYTKNLKGMIYYMSPHIWNAYVEEE